MTAQRSRDLWWSLLASLGVGAVGSMPLIFVTNWGGRLADLMVPMLPALAFGVIAFFFGRLILVVWGSLIVGGCMACATWIGFSGSMDDGVSVYWLNCVLLNLIDGVIGYSLGVRRRRRLREKTNSCSNCGYSRTGLTTDLCSECGSPWPSTRSSSPT